MSKYRTDFQLDKHDVELIECAIRKVIQDGVDIGADCIASGESLSRHRLQQLNQLLAKLHHQKVFYSQVKEPGVPAA